MKYLSVCSGIEAATMAWHPLGWNPVAFSEIEPFPSKVLAHHYPDVPNLGDMTKFKEWNIEQPDLLVGGTPCQSFSVAGLRKGLDDPRGNLMLTYLAITDRFKPKWIVWENVPGVLTSNGGKDFGTFLGALGELGYGFAYRVLDAQYVRTDGYPYAVPQRRRRVFVVGCLGDWRSAAAVLFDSQSLRENPPPRRSKGQEIAGTIGARTGRSIGAQDAMNGHMLPIAMSHGQANAEICEGYLPTLNCNHEQPIVFDGAQITSKENRSRVEPGLPCGTLNKDSRMTIALAGNTIGREPQNGGNGTGFDTSGASYTLTKTDVHAVAYRTNAAGQVNPQDGIAAALNTMTDPTAQFIAFGIGEKPDVGHCLRSGASKADKHESTTYIAQTMQVRRLTPTECERLQAFPDGYTNIPGASNSARYKALDNSMAVNVMQLIGERIQMVENLAKERVAA